MALSLCILSIATDIYIYFDLRRNFPRRPIVALTYGIFAVICWIFIAVCMLMPRRDSDSGILFQMWGIYSYLSILIPKTLFCLFSLIGQIPGLWKSKGVRLGLFAGLPVACLVFISMWWGAAVTRRQIEVVDVDVVSPRVPDAFDGYRIAQISDLHTGTWGDDTSFIQTLVDSVNALKPDVIFFTGDIVNRQSSEPRAIPPHSVAA